MLEILITTILLLVVFSGFGKIVSQLNLNIWDGFSGRLFSGILLLTTILTATAFFTPLTSTIEFITLLLGFSSFVVLKGYNDFIAFFKQNDKYWITPLIFILFTTSFSPYILDHFGYYVPTISWLSTFGITKGLVNMDLILAQTSFWHILQTGFSHIIDTSLRLNSIVTCIYVIYIFENRQWNLLIFLPFFYFFLQSPSPDLPVLALSILILNEILKGSKTSYGLFAASVFLFCIKPTLIWLPLISFIAILKTKYFGILKIIPAVVVLFLFILKNYFTFGFPIVPVQIGDLNLAWKPNTEILKDSAKTAIEKTYDLQYTFEEISKFSTTDYIVNWFTLKGLKSIINCGLILSILAFSIYAWLQKNTTVRWLWFAIVIKSILVLIFSAQYRFFLDVFLVIGFLFLQNIPRKTSVFIFYSFSFGICILLTFPQIIRSTVPSFFLGTIMKPFEWNQILKPGIYEHNKYTTHTVGNMTFNLTQEGPYIFDTPAPSITPYHAKQALDLGYFPQWINKHQKKEGIIYQKINLNEQKKLNDILTKYIRRYKSKQPASSD